MPAEPRRIVVKKKGGGHAHHGGAWKVAYADFVTAMMALFMVMWLLASTDQQSRKEISQYFRTGLLPDGSMAMNRAAQLKPSIIEESPVPPAKKGDAMAEARALRQAIQRMITSDPELEALAAQVSVKVTEEGVLIETVDRDGQSMLFDLASSALKPALVDFLQKLGAMLEKRGNKIRIMGHTDARPFVSKTGKTNWDLSYERASNARRVFETGGMMAAGQITAVEAHGSTQLRNTADPYAAENRRLSILVIHKPEAVEGEPGGPDAGEVAKPESQPNSQPASQPESQPKLESVAQPEPEPKPESVAQPEPQPKPQPKPESASQPESQSKPESASQPKPESAPHPDSPPKAESAPQAKPESASQPKAQPESQAPPVARREASSTPPATAPIRK